MTRELFVCHAINISAAAGKVARLAATLGTEGPDLDDNYAAAVRNLCLMVREAVDVLERELSGSRVPSPGNDTLTSDA